MFKVVLVDLMPDLFDAKHQGPVMPGSHSVERYVIEENLHCIIKTHWKERKTWWVTDFRLLNLLFVYFFLNTYVVSVAC